MNDDERKALADRIASDMFNEHVSAPSRFAYTGIVHTVIDRLDSEGRLREPRAEVKISDLWLSAKRTSEDIARLADEVETWPEVMALLSNPLWPEKIKAIRTVRTLVGANGPAPSLMIAKDVVDTICARHGWNALAWQGKS